MYQQLNAREASQNYVDTSDRVSRSDAQADNLLYDHNSKVGDDHVQTHYILFLAAWRCRSHHRDRWSYDSFGEEGFQNHKAHSEPEADVEVVNHEVASCTDESLDCRYVRLSLDISRLKFVT